MYTVLFGICMIISVTVLIYMAQKSYNYIDIYQWTIIVMVPVIIMSYWIKSRVTTPEAAAALVCFTYFDSTFLITALLFANMRTLGYNVKSWTKIFVYGLAGIHMAIVGLCFNNELYYRTVEVEYIEGLGHATEFTPGPLMTVHYLYILGLFLWMMVILVIARKKQGTYSTQYFFTYMILPIGAFVIYIVEAALSAKFTILPLHYALADALIAFRYDALHMHDINFLLSEKHDSNEVRGYVAIDHEGRFLCCNEESYLFMPFLKDQRVNEPIDSDHPIVRRIREIIAAFELNGDTLGKYRNGDLTYMIEISYFSIRGGGRRKGYLLDIRDGTDEQRAYDIIESYNEKLSEEVKEKTGSIRDMQRKIVLGMADMIENRDNNTGGHVRRTSDIIHIIVDEIIRQGKYDISEQMAHDIVRAAPTHDLGKISIDSNILNKPGRFTDEEYEIMKTHSTKSGEMVMMLLDGVEEERFVNVAYNVARYHHERWDGRGYPEGLVGSQIPLEARIMSVADVYDALVSKRVYKEPMSFEKSAAIMCENMGTQFDPNMKSVFLGCREKLQQYYIEHDR